MMIWHSTMNIVQWYDGLFVYFDETVYLEFWLTVRILAESMF